MNIYAIQNSDGDCEGLYLAASEEKALDEYREWTCLEDEEYEGTTAAHVFEEEVADLDDAGRAAWLKGYQFAAEKFAG